MAVAENTLFWLVLKGNYEVRQFHQQMGVAEN